MNQTKILRYSTKEIYLFLIIIFTTNILLIASFVFYIKEKQTATETVKIISEHITITKNNVHIPQNDISSLKNKSYGSVVLDKQTGKQVYEQYKPTEVPSQFDYGDILQFLAIIFQIIPVFSQIKRWLHHCCWFSKKIKLLCYSYNYLDIDSIRLIPLVAFGVLFSTAFISGFSYYLWWTHINRKIAPLCNCYSESPGWSEKSNKFYIRTRISLQLQLNKQILYFLKRMKSF